MWFRTLLVRSPGDTIQPEFVYGAPMNFLAQLQQVFLAHLERAAAIEP